jgi:hypothetical protein
MIAVDGVPIDATLAYDSRHGWLGTAESAMLTLSEFRTQAEITRSQIAEFAHYWAAQIVRPDALQAATPASAVPRRSAARECLSARVERSAPRAGRSSPGRPRAARVV